MDPRLDGIDVSENNLIEHWSDVPGNLGIVRAGQGGWFADKDYLWNISRARATKRYVGHYTVIENTVDTVRNQLQTPQAQADKFLQIVGQPNKGDFAVLDWESPRKDVPPPPLDDVLAVMKAIEDGGWHGRTMWYTFYSLAHGSGTVDAFAGRPLWLSTLGNSYVVGYRWCQELGAVLWQYDQDSVSGATSSPIDLNMILDAARLDALCGLVAEPQEPDTEEDEVQYFQIITDIGNVYLFGPSGFVAMGGLGTVHGALNESKMAPVGATNVPDNEAADFARRWKEGMSG